MSVAQKRLLGPGDRVFFAMLAAAAVAVANGLLEPGHPLHVSTYTVTLLGDGKRGSSPN